MNSTVEQIRILIERINRAWQTGHTDQLRDLFHHEMVIVGPCFQPLCRGREACVESYREFVANATVHEYCASDLKIETWGSTAVGTYAWSMTYEKVGERSRETGTDQFVFGQEEERWLALWRYVHFDPA
jgi:hypothetical protein